MSPGNWKTPRQKPRGIGIEAFSKPWKRSGTSEKAGLAPKNRAQRRDGLGPGGAVGSLVVFEVMAVVAARRELKVEGVVCVGQHHESDRCAEAVALGHQLAAVAR